MGYLKHDYINPLMTITIDYIKRLFFLKLTLVEPTNQFGQRKRKQNRMRKLGFSNVLSTSQLEKYVNIMAILVDYYLTKTLPILTLPNLTLPYLT